MNLRETPVEQEVKYEGRTIRLRVDKAQLPNGRIATREVVEHNGGVCIAALTEQRPRGRKTGLRKAAGFWDCEPEETFKNPMAFVYNLFISIR